MDANNNEIGEQGCEDFLNEMCDYGAYSRDSEEDQNYFSSSGTEDESVGTHMPPQNLPGTELLGSTSITQTEDELHAPNQQEYLESEKLIWKDPELAWPTFNSGMLDLPDLAPWNCDPASTDIPCPKWALSSPVNGLHNLDFMSSYAPGNIPDGSTSSSALDYYDICRPHFTSSGTHPWTPVHSMPTKPMVTQRQYSGEVPRLDAPSGSTTNDSPNNRGSEACSAAMTDLRRMDSTAPVDLSNSRPVISFDTFHRPENNVAPGICEMEDLNKFSYPSIIENLCQNEFIWDQKDTFSRIDHSRVVFGACSNPQNAIPAARQHPSLPRSHLMDEAVAFSVAQRDLPSRLRSEGMQETDVPQFTCAMETKMMSQEVDSPSLVSPNLLAFQVPENPKGKDPHHIHRALAPGVPLQGTSFSMTRRDPVSIIASQTTHQGHFSTFESRPSSSKKMSTRSCFNPEKRSRVADTRKKGACVACQARKVECKAVPGFDACMNCIKKAGEAITFHNICVRQQLEGTRFGIEDFYYLASRRRTLLKYDGYYQESKANATTTRISIGHAPKFGVQKLLSVEVQKYPGNDIGDRVFFKVGRDGGSNHSLYTTAHYMIVKNSLPSVEQLDLWGRELVQANCALDPHNLKSAMDSLLIRYCNVNRNPRIAQILDATLRMVSLNACRTRPPVNFEESMNRLNDLSGDWSDKDRERGVDVSDEVLAQLMHIALAGIENAEKSVLGSLDRLRKEMEIGRLEWVAVGVCLMRILLIYRDLTLRYVNGAKLVGSEAASKGNIFSRVERATLMYDTLTSVYGATFHKTISPLSSQWRTEDHLEALCNDQILMKAMEDLKFHYRRFCGGEEFEPEDSFFKTMIAMPMMQKVHKKQKNNQKNVLARFKQEI